MKTKEEIYEFVVNDLVKQTHIIKKKGIPSMHDSLSFDFYQTNEFIYSAALLGNYYTSATSFISFHHFLIDYLKDNFGILDDEIMEIWERYQNKMLPKLYPGLMKEK